MQRRPSRETTTPNSTVAIANLRGVLGDDTYESFASTGRQMTNTAMAHYALEQIDRARADLLLQNESS